MNAKKETQIIQGTKQEFLKLFREMCYSRSAWQVWSDLISMIACTLANSTDPNKNGDRYLEREKEYKQCEERIGGVDKPAQCMAVIVEALERNPEQDFLGELFMELELGNHWKGQGQRTKEVRIIWEQTLSGAYGKDRHSGMKRIGCNWYRYWPKRDTR